MARRNARALALSASAVVALFLCCATLTSATAAETHHRRPTMTPVPPAGSTDLDDEFYGVSNVDHAPISTSMTKQLREFKFNPKALDYQGEAAEYMALAAPAPVDPCASGDCPFAPLVKKRPPRILMVRGDPDGTEPLPPPGSVAPGTARLMPDGSMVLPDGTPTTPPIPSDPLVAAMVARARREHLPVDAVVFNCTKPGACEKNKTIEEASPEDVLGRPISPEDMHEFAKNTDAKAENIVDMLRSWPKARDQIKADDATAKVIAESRHLLHLYHRIKDVLIDHVIEQTGKRPRLPSDENTYIDATGRKWEDAEMVGQEGPDVDALLKKFEVDAEKDKKAAKAAENEVFPSAFVKEHMYPTMGQMIVDHSKDLIYPIEVKRVKYNDNALPATEADHVVAPSYHHHRLHRRMAGQRVAMLSDACGCKCCTCNPCPDRLGKRTPDGI